MKIEQYISELLYHHNCVIVPELGGFVTNYKSAYLHPATHTFSPPCKRIAFNSLLKNNDGLLANYITQHTALSYSQACEQIRDFVDYCNKRLNKGKKLNLENIGILSFDQEKNLQFIPDTETNYLLDSFGLTLVHSPAIRRDGSRPATVSDFNKRLLTEKVKRFRIKTKHIAYLSSAAAIAAVLFFSPVIISRLNINLSNLNPFESSKEIKTSIPETESVAPLISKKENKVVNILPDKPAPVAEIKTDSSGIQTASLSDIVTESKETINILPDKKSIEPIKKEETKSPAENSTELVADVIKPTIKEKNVVSKTAENKLSVTEPTVSDVANNSNAKYFIIVGAFKVYENAVNFVADLKSKGYDASIAGLNPRGLHMVSAAASANVYQATESLDAIHAKEFKDAWLYRKN